MRNFLLITCCWLLTVTALAQQRNVTGKVTDQTDGSSLPGVSVIVKGTNNGTVTDGDGNYSIQVATDDILTFSFIGFASQDVAVGEQTTINVALSSSIETLGEVVVIGFGTREKKDLTGSISSVQSKDIESVPFASPQFALQGKTTGVRVMNTSGNPSAGPQIFIRGVGTWVGSSQPLYVIDGQIITQPTADNQDLIGNINLWTLVNPNDIESISVLKDASAAAVYGSRAANGVILITTKKGRTGKPVVEFNSQYGVQNIKTLEVLSRSEFARLSREIYTNSTNPDISLENDLYGRNEDNVSGLLNNYVPQLDPESPFYLGDTGPSYNWQDALRQKNAVNQNYNLKISGASETTDYYLSFGLTDQESVLRGNDLRRYNFATNINTDIGKYVRTGFNYKFAYQQADDYEMADDLLFDGAAATPWQPIFDPNNRFGLAPVRTLYDEAGEWDPRNLYGGGTMSNWLANERVNSRTFDLMRNTGQVFVEFEPITGLVFRGGLSADYTYQQRENFMNILDLEFDPNAGQPGYPEGSFGNYGLRTNKFFNYQTDVSVSYSKTFNNHAFSILASSQNQYFKNWFENVGSDNAQTNDLNRISVFGTGNNVSAFSGKSERFWQGYVGRISYNFNKRYYLDLSARRDGSSGFPEAHRWGNFYAVAGAWRISDEQFMDRFTFLSDLKLKGGWGQTGNDEAVVGQYAYLSKVTEAGSYSFGSNENFGAGDDRDPDRPAKGNYLLASAIRDLPNVNFTWETVTTTNVGFDAAFLNNKITASVEYYSRVTDDILQAVNIPLSVGTTAPVFNIGSARNRGVDLELGYNGNFGDLTFNVSGNISFVNNKVLELYQNQPITLADGGSIDRRGNTDLRIEEGRSIGHLWGYQVGGVFQSQAEIDAYYANTPDDNVDDDHVAPGDMYFLDVHGDPTVTEPFYSRTPDGKINTYDQTEIGHTIPGHTYGLNVSAGFKGLDISLSFYGEGDVDRVNEARQRLEAMTAGGVNQLASTLERWTPQNPSSTMPRAVAGDPAANNRFSSRWVEGAGFFRLNTWQLGYSIPRQTLDQTTQNAVSRFRIYIGGQNNILVTNWSGIDPINDRYPLPRSIFAGLNVTF